MANSYADIVAGQDSPTVFSRLITLLQALPSGLSLPTSYWGGGDPIPVILEHGLSPLLATLYGYGSKIAQGMFLRGALTLAQLDQATWDLDPMATFLGWLAVEVFAVTPKPPAKTLGTWKVTNSGGPVTLPATFAVQDPVKKLKYLLVGGPVTVKDGDFIVIEAEKTGSEYNLDPGTITKLVTTIAGITGSNQAAPPSTSWLVLFGGARETPASVATRCRANWGRLSLLQTSPTDAYVAMALDPAVTGTSAVKKVAVWQHYKDGVGQAANYVTLYLAGDAGPVTMGEAAQVQAGMLPWIGLHDKLLAKPCDSVSYAPKATVYVGQTSDIAPAKVAITAQFQLLQRALAIGGTVYAAGNAGRSILGALAQVPQITVIEQVLVDFVPAKKELVTVVASFGAAFLDVKVGP